MGGELYDSWMDGKTGGGGLDGRGAEVAVEGVAGAVDSAGGGLADVGADIIVGDAGAADEVEVDAAAFVSTAAAAIFVGEFDVCGDDGRGKAVEAIGELALDEGAEDAGEGDFSGGDGNLHEVLLSGVGMKTIE